MPVPKSSLKSAVALVNSGKKVPALDLVKAAPEQAALLSKLVSSKERKPYYDNRGNRVIDSESLQGFHQLSQEIGQRSENSESMLQLFPETELAAQILISSIISPKDMTKTDVNITAPDNLKSSKITALLLDEVKEYFLKVYKIQQELPKILRNVLIKDGSDPRVVIPENSIDDLINGSSRISLEALSDFVDVNTGVFRSLGFLGNPTNGGNRAIASPSSAKHLVQEALGAPEYGVGYDPFIKAKSDKGSIVNFNIAVIDNPYALKMPLVIGRNKRYATEDLLEKGRIGETAARLAQQRAREHGYKLRTAKEAMSEATVSTESRKSQSLSDSQLTSLFYKNKYSGTVNFLKVRSDDEMARRTVGEPLKMKLPPESVIPVFTPGNEEKHVGYIVLLDFEGNPLSRSSNMNYVNELHSRVSNKTNNMSSFLLNKANASMNGRNCTSIDVAQATRLFADIVESDVLARLRNGINGKSVNLVKNEEVYRLMLARHFANQMTQMLFVPCELMTYFAYKYDNRGIGVSLLESTRMLNSLRSMLLFSKVMAQTKNAIGNTNVDVQLDPDDPDPDKTIAMCMHEIARTRQQNFPLGVTSPADIGDWMQRAGFSFTYTNHPGLPDMKLNFSETGRSYPLPDTDLEDELRKRTIMTMGLSPETVDAGFQADFATTVVANNVLLAKRVMQIQEVFVPQLTDHMRKVAVNDGNLMESLRSLVFENYDELMASIDDDDETKMLADNKELTVKLLVSEFISNIEAQLPEPDSSTLDNQMIAYDKYVQAVESALGAWVGSDSYTASFGGETAEKADELKAMFKAYFLRKFMAENNIMPELAEVMNNLTDKEEDFKFMKEQADHINKLTQAIVVLVKTTQPVVQAAAADVEKLTNGDGLADSTGGGFSDSSSSGGFDDGGFGGGMDIPDLDMPAGGEPTDAAPGTGQEDGQEQTPQETGLDNDLPDLGKVE